jgi:hypothetical protein
MPIDKDLAAGGVEHGPYVPEQLFAGDSQIVTGNAPTLTAVTKYQVVRLTATGVTNDLASTTTGDKCVIAAQTAASGASVPFYSAGYFNHAVLTWPAALDTLAKRKEFFMGTNIQVGEITN